MRVSNNIETIMRDEAVERKFKAPCPVSVFLVAVKVLDQIHNAEYAITEKDTLFFKCRVCDSQGFVNSLDSIRAIIQQREG